MYMTKDKLEESQHPCLCHWKNFKKSVWAMRISWDQERRRQFFHWLNWHSAKSTEMSFLSRHVVAVECQKDPFISETVLFLLYGVFRSDLFFYLSWGSSIPELLLAHNGPSLQCMTAFSNLQPVANPGWSPLSLCPSYSPSTGSHWSALYSLVKWHSLGVVLYTEQANLTLSDCRSVLTDLWMDESAFVFLFKNCLGM